MNANTEAGYVYFLTNSSMPDLVKIGGTTNTDGGRLRAKQMNTTGVPEPFFLVAEFCTSDVWAIESEIHEALDQYRIRGKEFFNFSECGLGGILTIAIGVFGFGGEPIESEGNDTSIPEIH